MCSGTRCRFARDELVRRAPQLLRVDDGERAAVGVECAAMTAEADQIGPAMVLLPGVPAYLRSVYELGRRSLRPALPALALLFLYRLGMSAYGALTNYSEALKGHALGGQVVARAAPILLLALIYIPFLPLQESILRRDQDFPAPAPH